MYNPPNQYFSSNLKKTQIARSNCPADKATLTSCTISKLTVERLADCWQCCLPHNLLPRFVFQVYMNIDMGIFFFIYLKKWKM